MLESVLQNLHSLGAIKFGDFTLKSGLKSPVYFDLRLMVSQPSLMKNIADLLHQVNPEAVSTSDLLCGVPYTALPLATLMSVDSNKPMLIRRKEAKSYGTAQILEGKFERGQSCLIIEDVITSGQSILETADLLRSHGLKVETALVFLDRGQGGYQNLASHGIKVYCVTDVTTLMTVLLKHGCTSQEMVDQVMAFTSNNKVETASSGGTKSVCKLLYEERLLSSPPGSPISRLFKIMLEKQSNLCVAADLSTMDSIEKLISKIGAKICCLKIHYDIIDDWTPGSGQVLKTLATKFNFLLMEDRKFFDIGKTVKSQLSTGLGCISSWTDLITIVTMPGPAILKAIEQVNNETSSSVGALLVAEMSSKDNFFTAAFSKSCVDLLAKFPYVAVGLIAQSRLEKSNPSVIQMTPGVKLNDAGNEGLGQQYISPEEAIIQRGADVIIVGRGVTHAEHVEETVEAYRYAGWTAYLKRTK